MGKDKLRIFENCDAYLGKPISKIDLVKKLMNYLPYTESTKEIDGKKPEISNILTKETLQAFPGLYGELQNWKAYIEKIRDIMAITKISVLGDDVIEMGKKYNCSELLKWGEDLAEAVSDFEIDMIEELLDAMASLL